MQEFDYFGLYNAKQITGQTVQIPAWWKERDVLPFLAPPESASPRHREFTLNAWHSFETYHHPRHWDELSPGGASPHRQ